MTCQSLEAGILGALLIYGAPALRALELSADEFTGSRREIFDAIMAAAARGQADVETVARALRERDSVVTRDDLGRLIELAFADTYCLRSVEALRDRLLEQRFRARLTFFSQRAAVIAADWTVHPRAAALALAEAFRRLVEVT